MFYDFYESYWFYGTVYVIGMIIGWGFYSLQRWTQHLVDTLHDVQQQCAQTRIACERRLSPFLSSLPALPPFLPAVPNAYPAPPFSTPLPPIPVALKLRDTVYPLFDIRADALRSPDDRVKIVNALNECRKAMSRGEYLYAALAEFYGRLSFTMFNFFIIRDQTDEDNPIISEPPLFLVHHQVVHEDLDALRMGATLSTLLTP